jgi:hypothetical protein
MAEGSRVKPRYMLRQRNRETEKATDNARDIESRGSGRLPARGNLRPLPKPRSSGTGPPGDRPSERERRGK